MGAKTIEKFIGIKEAAAIRGASGADPIKSTQMWLWRWNKRHPFGDPLHIYRQPGLVHEESFRKALEANEEEQA